MRVLVLHYLLAAFLTEKCLCRSRDIIPNTIVRIARKYADEGSKKFLWVTEMPKWAARKQSDKSHLFVAQVLQEAGISAPTRMSGLPIGAREWENPISYILLMSSCWTKCGGNKQPGDVIAMNGHVAIVTSYWGSTSPAFDSVPKGVVEESTWGFHQGDSPVCWRFRYANTITCFHY